MGGTVTFGSSVVFVMHEQLYLNCVVDVATCQTLECCCVFRGAGGSEEGHLSPARSVLGLPGPIPSIKSAPEPGHTRLSERPEHLPPGAGRDTPTGRDKPMDGDTPTRRDPPTGRDMPTCRDTSTGRGTPTGRDPPTDRDRLY